MSYLFRGNRKYFDFIESLEKEEQEFRKMNQECAAKSEMCNNEFKIQARNVTNTLRRVGAREIRHVQPSKTAKSRSTASIKKTNIITTNQNKTINPNSNKGSFLNTKPARLVSKKWPIRPNSAFRILTPQSKLNKFNDLDDDFYTKQKDPPLIHSTGISNSSQNIDIFNKTQSSKVNEYGSINTLNEVYDDD